MKPYTTIAAMFLLVVAVLHAVRLLRGTEVLVAGTAVPIWASAIAAPVLALLAFMLSREARR
jgi:hypothetical protein